MKSLLPAVLVLSGCDTLGPFFAQFIPALEYANEEWAPITMDCEEPYSSRKPKRCTSQTIRCGDTIRGNNKMGRSRWSSDFYRKATCLAVSTEVRGIPHSTPHHRFPAFCWLKLRHNPLVVVVWR